MKLNELQLCITSVCNIGCKHCHLNKLGDHMTLETFNESLDLAERCGIEHIRLTGGTVFEHPDLLMWLKILKKRNFKVIINISILSIEDFYPIIEYCDYILFSFYSAGQIGRYGEKLAALKESRGDKLTLMGCTVYQTSWSRQIPELVKNSEMFDFFFFLRDTTKHTKEYYNSLNESLEKSSQLTKRIFIANGFPMCFLSKRNLKLCTGAKFDNGNERFYIKPDGTIKPSAYSKIELGKVGDGKELIDIWKDNQTHMDEVIGKINTCNNCSVRSYCKNGITTLKTYESDPLFAHSFYNKYPTELQKILREKLFKLKSLDELKLLYHDHSSFYMQYPPSDYWNWIKKDELIEQFKIKDERLNLYIHFPFCSVACTFCNVKKFSQLQKQKRVQEILDQIDDYKEIIKNNDIGSVYFGGGSPQLMEYDGAKQVFEKLFPLFRNKPEEVNFEMFPRDYDEKLVHYIRKYVTRISMGVQCFNEKNLRRLNRLITKEQMISYISKIKDMKFEQVNLDVIFGLFMNEPELFEADLKEILALKPTHITYQPLHFTKALKYDDGDNIKNQITLNPIGRRILEEHGFTQNSGEDFSVGESLKYQGAMLNQENLLGIGENTFGLVNNICYKNEEGKFRFHKLTQNDKLFGKLFLASRFLKVDVGELDRIYEINYKAEFSDSIRYLLSVGFIEFKKNVIHVTKSGLDYVDLISNILSLSNLDYKLKK